ncbi:MAG: tRNA preQ1(34) S-adenosylmethionine ribosyltransferase-isomerase QueA [Janthinobacterium lividum]
MAMKLHEFKFELPQELVATHPARNRDDSRLLVLHRATGQIEHRGFKDILDYFTEGDTFVLNDTKVFPARMYGNKEKTGATIEVFLLRELNKELRLWDVLVDPARKIRVGNKLYFGESDMVAEVIDNTTSRGRTIKFLFDGSDEDFRKALYELGETPIPKEVLNRETEAADKERYQTIYAENIGAVAVPAAGLHFTREVMKRMEIKGIETASVTLHVGLGTFRTVDVEDLTKHKTDSENFIVGPEACAVVNKALDAKKRVCAIGTTTLRAMESSVSANARMKPTQGWNDRFIFPPYEFKIANCLLTNLHLPESTLIMITAAFAGYPLLMEAYKEAIKEKYRFFSYGDAMLIL